jgi:hypothetical protein
MDKHSDGVQRDGLHSNISSGDWEGREPEEDEWEDDDLPIGDFDERDGEDPEEEPEETAYEDTGSDLRDAWEEGASDAPYRPDREEGGAEEESAADYRYEREPLDEDAPSFRLRRSSLRSAGEENSGREPGRSSLRSVGEEDSERELGHRALRGSLEEKEEENLKDTPLTPQQYVLYAVLFSIPAAGVFILLYMLLKADNIQVRRFAFRWLWILAAALLVLALLLSAGR